MENIRPGVELRPARRMLFATASCAVVALCLLAAPAAGQSLATDAPPPVHSSIDANGVDLIYGTFNLSDSQVSVGQPSSGGLSRVYFGGLTAGTNIGRDNLAGTINSSGTTYTVSVGSASIPFTLSGSTFTSQLGDGSTLAQTSSTIYTAVFRDGTVAVFSTAYAGVIGVAANVARITSLTKPNGEVESYTYSYHSYTPPGGPFSLSGWRVEAVTNNYGYEMKYLYYSSSNSITDFQITQIIGINNAVDYCAPSATSCSALTVTWPSATINGNQVTDVLGRKTTYFNPAASSTQTLTRPSGATLSVTYDSSTRVTSVSNGVGTWSYNYSGGTTQTTTVTDPNGHTRVMVSNTSTGLVTSDTDGLSHTTSYAYDSYGRPQTITNPENDSITYTYDARGNVTQTTVTGTDGVSTLSTTAGYDGSCSYPAKCNEPNWTKDARGNETDYVYYPPAGLLVTATAPTGANGLRPQINYYYSNVTAYYNQGSGIAAGSTLWLIGAVTRCPTGPACNASSTAEEGGWTYDQSGAATNLLPTQISHYAGDASINAITQFTYDSVGNISTTIDPLGYATKYWFNGGRELVGVVGPDPDGSGPLANRAVRYTYECDVYVTSGCDGLATEIEQGTTASQSYSDWTSFTSLAQRFLRYDTVDRKILDETLNGANPISYSQYSWDNANRPTCAAVRMDTAALGSLPSSACSLGTAGSYGPDKITMLTYDNADRPVKATVGYGTASQGDAVTSTLGADGETLTQADAKGNLTTYVMDPFNRLAKVEFPTPSNGPVSSTSDFEQYTYDANGNITQDRRRDGSTITYGVDALNLVTSGYGGATYSYDNMGRRTSASVSGQTLSFAYDALGRQISETGPLGTVSRSFDLKGNKTRLTYPDGYYVLYYFDPTNALGAIVDNTSNELYAVGYDNFGRTNATYREYGPTGTFNYGSDLRLSALTYTFADSSKTVTYNTQYDPSGGLTLNSPTNGLYNWSVGNSTTSYATDGQNKYTAAGSASPSYDGRANLSYDGATSYGYDGLNRLTTAGSASLVYDALGRLYQTTGSSSTLFLYDGIQIIAEYNGSSVMQNRYVADVGLDQPLIWFPGSGTTYTSARWPLVDPTGSIGAVSTTGTSNTTYGINTYDPFGVAGSGNVGRFQFKGMPWVPETGKYHTRARAYNPALGRFMQADPAGYVSDINLYSFGGNDPVNKSDATGLDYTISIPGGIRYCSSDDDRDYDPSKDNGTGQYGDYNGPQGNCENVAGVPGTIGSITNILTRLITAISSPFAGPCNQTTGSAVASLSPLGGTVFVGLLGVSANLSFGVALPTASAGKGSLSGLQVFGSVSGTVIGGLGLYAGAGPSGGFGFSPGAISTGAAPAVPVIQGGAAAEAGAEFAGQIGTFNGGIGDSSAGVSFSGSAGPRGGLGIYGGLGSQKAATLASPPLFCR